MEHGGCERAGAYATEVNGDADDCCEGSTIGVDSAERSASDRVESERGFEGTSGYAQDGADTSEESGAADDYRQGTDVESKGKGSTMEKVLLDYMDENAGLLVRRLVAHVMGRYLSAATGFGLRLFDIAVP